MAAAVGVAALCRRLTAALRLPGARARPTAAGLPGLTQNPFHKNLVKVEPVHQLKFLHTSLSRRGLEEFFDDPKNWGETTVKSGDAWNIKQLRAKSSEDLHKLWYVLLKEKNMLLTLEQESKRQLKPMPSPERLEKVEKSMKNIDLVVKERETALRLLQTGHEKPVPGEWRYDFLGRTYCPQRGVCPYICKSSPHLKQEEASDNTKRSLNTCRNSAIHIIVALTQSGCAGLCRYTYKEWPIPWYLNKKYKKRRFYYLRHVDHFIRLRLEKFLRRRARKQSLERTRRKVLERKFPHLAAKSQSQQ